MDATSRPRRPRTNNSRSRSKDGAAPGPENPRHGLADILERAERLTAAEIRALASAYRGEVTAGAQDPDGRERAHRRARAVSIAITRSGRTAEALDLQESASVAVRAAAARVGIVGSRSLGVIGDAELAVGDAALAALLADHFSPEVAALLRDPFDRVLSPGGDAGAPGAGR